MEEQQHAPMDAKKKKMLIGVAGFGVVLVGYFYFKNRNSSSASPSVTSPSGSGVTSYIPYGGNTVDTGGGGGGMLSPLTGGSSNTATAPVTSAGQPINIFNMPSGGSDTVNSAPAGGASIATSTSAPVKRSGKTAIHHVVTKPQVHSSGGTTKISGSTSTARTSRSHAVSKVTHMNAARYNRSEKPKGTKKPVSRNVTPHNTRRR